MFNKSASQRLYTTAKSSVNDDEYYSNINTSVSLARIRVPLKQKQLAANYILIKKIFGNCTAAIPVTNSDRATLFRHGYMPLEYTTISQANRQLEQMKNWANGGDILLATYSNELFEIRIKELKYLTLTINSRRNIEFEDGYKAYEKYVEYIAN